MDSEQYASAQKRIDAINARTIACSLRVSKLKPDMDAPICKDGEASTATGPDSSDVHVPAPLGAKPAAKKPKKKVASDGK